MSIVRRASSSAITLPEPVPPLLRDLVHERTGIYFDDERLDTMIDKLEFRAIARGCKSYLDYYYLLKYDEGSQDEWRRVMDAFSVQETYFWRELDQIRALVDHIVPAWFATNTGPLRIWSAACATGEEPYSIAMALAEAGWGSHPISIVASDASDAALNKARAGVFRERSFRSLPLGLKLKYFEPEGETHRLRPEISSRVSFHWANLLDLAGFTPTLSVDVIFCRNVFIYFSSASISRVVHTFAGRLPARGPLFIGSSESLLKLTEEFDLEELGTAFVYRRKAIG